MTRLQRRLLNLEAEMTDRSGLIQGGKVWFNHWLSEAAKLMAGEDLRVRIPLAFVDALISDDGLAEASTPCAKDSYGRQR